MEIGKLNRLVTILHQQPGQDAAGQPSSAWVQFAKPWANIKHLSGAAAIRADAETSVVQASIRIRYRLDITAAMRVQHRANIYEIKAVLPDEQGKQHIDLVCELLPASVGV
ncbi:phage head closure protein [Rhodoferax sp. WC2427]|uniref:phage head closure protein n=1 Tax=Rhodoferax sp. WC2427 TaxID=3234144 RepID=UPI003465BDC7